jgi:hypothetical protein
MDSLRENTEDMIRAMNTAPQKMQCGWQDPVCLRMAELLNMRPRADIYITKQRTGV